MAQFSLRFYTCFSSAFTYVNVVFHLRPAFLFYSAARLNNQHFFARCSHTPHRTRRTTAETQREDSMVMTIELSQGHGMSMAVAIASAFVVTWAGKCCCVLRVSIVLIENEVTSPELQLLIS